MNCRDDLFKTITQIKERYSGCFDNLYTSNESETRLLIIDEILKALGWETSDFNPEFKTKTGQFIDYLLSDEGVGKCIVEAKRSGKTFFHSKRLTQSSYTLSFLVSCMGIAFKEVLEQAQKYSVDTGIPFAVINDRMGTSTF